MLEQLTLEGRRDNDRPWWHRTTGSLLVAVVLAAVIGGVLVDLAR